MTHPHIWYEIIGGDDTIQGRLIKYHWRTTEQRSTHRIPLFLDSMWRGGGPYRYGNLNRYRAPEFNGEWRGAGREMMHFAIDRHNGKMNTLFLDFSVRPVGVKELWNLKWHKNWDSGYFSQDNGPGGSNTDGDGNGWPDWMDDLDP